MNVFEQAEEQKKIHGHKLRNFIKRNVTPETWVSKVIIIKEPVVQKMKLYLQNNGVPVDRT